MMLSQAGTITFNFSSTFVIQGLSALGREINNSSQHSYMYIYIYMLNDKAKELGT